MKGMAFHTFSQKLSQCIKCRRNQIKMQKYQYNMPKID